MGSFLQFLNKTGLREGYEEWKKARKQPVARAPRAPLKPKPSLYVFSYLQHRCDFCGELGGFSLPGGTVNIYSCSKHLMPREKAEQVVRSLNIVSGSTGRRQRYALYRLWRYLDVPKPVLSRAVGRSEYDLSDLFGDIFAEQCLSSDKCVLKPFLPSDPIPMCALEGCSNPARWNWYKKKYGMFCSLTHFHQYKKTHPEVMAQMVAKRPEVIRRREQTEETYRMIREGKVRFQSQLRQLYPEDLKSQGGKASTIVRRLVEEGRVERKGVLFNGRWTFELTAKG